MKKSNYDITDIDIINEAYDNIYNENLAALGAQILPAAAKAGQAIGSAAKHLRTKLKILLVMSKQKLHPC